ncbi:MAG: glycosyltransferase family 2 protein [Candidatus Omnitrophica bacterium]|nr:glycosyltransferase family 2 protein [Candidatus Omnitrophota bacterium]
MRISIIIPAHNEEKVIADTIHNIERNLKLDYEIVVVNDHSDDNTAGIIKGLANQYGNLRLVDNDRDKGFANALRKGIFCADSDLIIPVMADLCDDTALIERMHAKALEGFDIVCASRYMRGGKKIRAPLLKSFFSKVVSWSLKAFIGIPTSDAPNSFKCYRRAVLDTVKIEGRGFEVSMEITLKAFFAGFGITEIPTVWKGRSLGKSKFHLFQAAPAYIKLYLWAMLQKLPGNNL